MMRESALCDEVCRELMRALVRGSAKKFRAPSILWANFGLVEESGFKSQNPSSHKDPLIKGRQV